MVEFLHFLVLVVMLVVPRFSRRRLVGWLWIRPTTGSPPATDVADTVKSADTLDTAAHVVIGAVAGAALDLCRSKRELAVENALLRQQLTVLRRQVNQPRLNTTDRAVLVLLAGRLRTWKSALFIVQPDTLLRWHRAGFRLLWRRKSRTASRKPNLPPETVELIQRMAVENRLWGAERIRGELLKLDIRVCKRTIQKYMHETRKQGPSEGKPNQNWTTFLHNHAYQVWAADFLAVYDLFFSPLFVFLIIELGSRRVVHFGVTRSPTDEWTAQQLREAAPFGQVPRFLIRDNDSKYADKFRSVAVSSGIEVLRTPYKTPRANAFCERFVGSVRRECTDHMLILGERHLHSVIKEYAEYHNCARPHQGIGQRIPEAARSPVQEAPPVADGADRAERRVISLPVLGGLHHDYRRDRRDRRAA